MILKEIYTADERRYDNAEAMYARCGRSGILLPRISLGFWQNFGHSTPYDQSRAITHYAFDNGITHFDLANNYGPPYGTAEETMGRLMKEDFGPYRDELFISTKAGYDMWPGPYGNWGSRKYLFASLDQSLKRMNLEYVDLFYIHRYDPVTPLEETLQALADIVRNGKALYVGISRWPLEALKTANDYLKKRDVPPLIFQGRLNLLDRAVQQEGILDYCQANGIGFISFSPLAQGLLTERYLNGIPAGSRMSRQGTLTDDRLTPATMQFLKKLNAVATRRGEPMAATALSWILAQQGVTSVLTGVSSVEQLKQSIACVKSAKFTAEEIAELQEAPAQE
jgi:L-glyceraldehyde 3-phosphate reductase